MKPSLKISFLFLLLLSCSSSEPAVATPTVIIPSTETLSLQLAARQQEITAIWERGGHARAEIPVGCEACHEMQAGLSVDPDTGQDPHSNTYEALSNINALCGNCHADSVVDHAHADFSCITCHDAHSTYSSCTDSGCHANMSSVFHEVPATPTGGHPETGSSFCGSSSCHSAATAVAKTGVSIHGSSHTSVPCVVCHDASGLQAAPPPGAITWALWREVELDGEIIYEPISSHSIRLEVDCARCHFEDNPWGLNIVTGGEFK